MYFEINAKTNGTEQVCQEKRRHHGVSFGPVLKVMGETEVLGVCHYSWEMMYKRGQQTDWEVPDPRAGMTLFRSALTLCLLPWKSFLP